MDWRQTIIWTNDDYFTDAYMRHSALMNQLIFDIKRWPSHAQEIGILYYNPYFSYFCVYMQP